MTEPSDEEPAVGVLPSQTVQCPEGCLMEAGIGRALVVPRYFRWMSGKVGSRNYCERCGSKLVDAETGEEVEVEDDV